MAGLEEAPEQTWRGRKLMQEIYQKVAEQYVAKINAVFESEETLKAEFAKTYSSLPFTRTDFWQPIIHGMFRDVWFEYGPVVKSEPQGHDKMVVMRIVHGLLDYNLFTQVLLNMQNYLGLGYDLSAVGKDLAEVKDKWAKDAKLDPWKPGSKMIKTAATFEENAYNRVLSMQRAKKIIEDFSGGTSFRVSPKGSTPAFADSKNISMIGVGGDHYLRTLPTLQPYYFTWDTTPTMAEPIPDPFGMRKEPGLVFGAPGIPYPFVSKSGGEILQEVLFARKIMYEVFWDVDITQKQCIQIPRINSVLVVTQKPCPELRATVARLQKQWPALGFVEGARDGSRS
jgi:hypothetical protein